MGGLAIAGPLTAFSARAALGLGRQCEGYGPLIDQGDLALPKGFTYKIISRQGDPMSDGNPTPGIFDGMAAFDGPGNTTVLIRNHENRRRSGETPVLVPAGLRYDSDASYNAGNTKVVVAPDLEVISSFAILGGTSTNCAGGQMPWGSWVTCEEVFDDGDQPHGYAFEIDADAGGPVPAVPIKQVGRFVHEACAFAGGRLYETEDRGDSCFFRYTPDRRIRRPGDLLASDGDLEALVIDGHPTVNTNTGWPVGQSFPVSWVKIDEPDPATNTVREEAQSKGAAIFNRQEGIWTGDHGKLYFDCTDGGAAGRGQIWEYDHRNDTITLVYESPGAHELKNPDNLVVAPTGDVLLCEDSSAPQFLRGLTVGGEVYDFARTITGNSEFCGACFDPRGRVLFVNQQGDRDGEPGVTYAIKGPWSSRRCAS